MLNRIIIMGRLTWDPELRRTQSGVAVTRFRLAVDRDFKTQNGERETDFIDCIAWREKAEFVSKYFTKGRMAIVEGSLQVRDWTDQDGGKRRSAEVVADKIHFGETKRDAYGDGGAASYGGGYGSAPGYGSGSGYGGGAGYGGGNNAAPASGYASAPAPGYSNGAAPAPGYAAAPPAAAPSDFSEVSEEDGDLPF